MDHIYKNSNIFRDQYFATQKLGNKPSEKIQQEYFLLFNLLIEEISQDANLHFTTLFSRIAFISTQFNIRGKNLRLFHLYRVLNERKIENGDVSDNIALGKYLCNFILRTIFKATLEHVEIPSLDALHKITHEKFEYFLEGICYQESDGYYFIAEKTPHESVKLIFEKKILKEQLDLYWPYLSKPLSVNLIDVELKDEAYYPNCLVIEPDYLIDVTSISESFKSDGVHPASFFVRRFLPVQKKVPLMLGNIANHFLDELIANTETEYSDLVSKIFQIAPLVYTNYDNVEVKDLSTKSKSHFANIKKVVTEKLPALGINVNAAYTEPSFLSRKYGMQGRLDVLHHDDISKRYDIIELKSGSAFKANVYGLAKNHYTQTLLYDLMIKSVFGTSLKASNYILYSKLNSQSLRFAPSVKAQQFDALILRNTLVYFEKILESLDEENAFIIFVTTLKEEIEKAEGFLKKDLTLLLQIISTLDQKEQLYFRLLVSFIAKEHRLSKVGEHGIDKSNGLASLWLDPIFEKEENFNMLSSLVITENNSFAKEPLIELEKSEFSNPLSRFREGDIALLYPYTDAQTSPLHNQIFKCSIIKIDNQKLTIRLRNRQNNQSIFKKNNYWNLEPDHLDSGFISMYRAVFAWASYPQHYRELMLTKRAPSDKGNQSSVQNPNGLTEEQNLLFNKMINAKDYFLLWGPPGTGKTSVMIKSYVKYAFESKETILLLAFTNRAVDELCAAIEKAGIEDYIRVGSRYSTKGQYTNKLLSAKTEDFKTRKEFKQFLDKNTIYVSTISSIVNRMELFQLLKFDTIVVDEASQILEPLLLQVLFHCKKFILVGDHKQLPAVVVQNIDKSNIEDPPLKELLGTSNLRTSLFERFYNKAIHNSWDSNYGALSLQGRMHQKLVHFPSEQFYHAQLGILPSIERLTDNMYLDEGYIWNHRLLYFDTKVDDVLTHKTNVHEAKLVSKIISLYIENFKNSGIDLDENHIGIITPYRAQIAMITKEMHKLSLPVEKITVDTVERFQGGARDHIIISMCVNKSNQLRSLTSFSEDGTDRKFNVAITRAKESLAIVGNRGILELNPIYKEWIRQAQLCTEAEILRT